MKIGLVSCSNGQPPEQKKNISQLIQILSDMGISAVTAKHFYAKDGIFGGTAKERAEALMTFYQDKSIDAVFDVSGGDLANEVLAFLDYGIIAGLEKMFWGYSDLTAIINAVYAKTGRASVLYQVKNLVRDNTGLQRKQFQASVTGTKKDLYQIRYTFLQGQKMEGTVTGGNIRCLLKLAGTPYWPDMQGKILLLESLGAGIPQTAAFFSQLEQMGVFKQVSGILLGTFTKLEQSENAQTPFQLLSSHIPPALPVARTPDIGHSPDAKAIVIGSFQRFSEIKTKRLTLKPLGMQYLNTSHEYTKDPENTKYMLYLPNDTIEDTIQFLEDTDREWQKKEPSYYEFAILYRDTISGTGDTLHIGSIGIELNAEKNEAEFGWIISKKYWNRGIAFEAAQALLSYARQELRIPHFTAHCDSENTASYHVMEKLGMKRTAVYGGRKNKQSQEERTEYLYRL